MRQSDKNSIILNEVESTNNYANQLILSEAAEEGTVVLARHQKNGKGQAGNHWESEAGENLLASIILFPGFLFAGEQFLISKLVSLALFDFLKEELKDEEVTIKWPNDLYIGNKKVAGILIENAIKGHTLYSSVIGIGLNLNQEQFLSDAPNPVSLKIVTGKTFNIEQVGLELRNRVLSWYTKLKEGKKDEIDAAYFFHLFRQNQWNLFKKENRSFEARIVGIGEFGQLLLENRDGTVFGYQFKEVEFVLA